VPFLVASIAAIAALVLLRRAEFRGAGAAALCAVATRGATALLEARRGAGVALESAEQFEHPAVALGCEEAPDVLRTYAALAALYVLCAAQAAPDARARERLLAACAYALVAVHWWAGSAGSHELVLFAPRVACVCIVCAAVCALARSRERGRPWLAALLAAVPLALALGPQSPLALLLVAVQLASLASLRRALGGGALAALGSALTSTLLAQHAFFALGHHTRFSTLQHSCGFVGLSDFHPIVSPALVALNTVGGHVMALLPIGTGATERNREVAFAAASGVFGASALVTAVFVAAERRHLMVWAVFAPKLVFEAGLCCLVHVGLVFTALL
jgi:hypothetical protein